MVKQPKQMPARPPLTLQQIQAAKYLGSAEHKVERWWGGLPEGYLPTDGVAARPGKQKTTICLLSTQQDRDLATVWVQAALEAGQFRFLEGDGDYPMKIWYSALGQTWFGRCTNTTQGHYKGWPITEDERLEIFGRVA